MIYDYNFWSAVGTVGAVIVALGIAAAQGLANSRRQKKERELARLRVATLVNSWVDLSYFPNETGEYYRRKVELHLANESDEPVFNVEVRCGIKSPQGYVRVGPLSAPNVIPVLPPKREFVFDITSGFMAFGLFAHETFNLLVSSVYFQDHAGVSWEREFGNELRKNPKRDTLASEENDPLREIQIGDLRSPLNPQSVVLYFIKKAEDPEVSNAEFQKELVSHARGWGNLDEDGIIDLRKTLVSSNLAAQVWYPAPKIAYVRLLLESPEEPGDYPVEILTLVWRNSSGWNLFSIGVIHPWEIHFSENELNLDQLDGRK
ncbi:MAG: hypothetical protein Q4A31_05155 [Corynebacterium sp.]|uniref:hypothetical protein n=1 Tax=Corynebacterium sp. TaxID=1720 RepID=UPI0026DCE952|nr:hypothetical protein [Corynebacterium sp.]MDO4761286.1 hypothetical protein [Corynebacterium sp.]